MALQIADRVKETTTTTSTGTYALAGAVDGFQSFAAVGNGNTTYYACTDGTDYEVGIGSFTLSGNTLTRVTILESSNSDAAVNWGAGTKEIFVTVPAEKYLVRDANGNVSLTGSLTISGTVDGRDVSVDGSKLDGIESGATADQTAAQIRAKVEAASDSNVFTDADHSKLNGIEANAKNDQTITAGGGLTGGGTGDVTISHADTSSQASVNGSGRTYIQDITLDTYGHVTGLATGTETVVNTDTNTTDWRVQNSGGTEQFAVSAAEGVRFAGSGATSVAFDASTQKITISSTDTNTDTNTIPNNSTITLSAGGALTGGGNFTTDQSSNETITFNHSDTSSQGSVNNSSGTVIQDVTLDGYGHVTGLASVNLDGRYYTETEADSRFVNVTGDTMTAPLTIDTNTSGMLRLSATNSSPWAIDLQRDDTTNSRVYNGGGYWQFEHRPRVASNIIYDQGYHPEADKWTTARTLSLSGDASGSVSWDGSANATLSVAVSNDSHTHDGRYFTESESDGRFVRKGVGYIWTAVGGNALSFRSNDTIDTASGDQAALEIYQDNAGHDAFIQFHVAGDYGKYLGLHGGVNDFVVGGWSHGASYQRLFHDGYHPNADTLTTARTINGVSFNGSANITIADSTKLPLSGGTVTGDVQFNSGANIHRGTHSSGYLVGSYNSVGANSQKSNPIYTIGSSYQPSDTDLASMYGIGYSHGNANFDGISSVLSGWGLYVAADGNARIGLDASNGNINLTGTVDGRNVSADGNKLDGIAAFANNYTLPAGPSYIDVATGNYGTVKVDDDRGLTWAGYAIRDDWVFMSNGAAEAGIYNDTDNEWAILCLRNADTRLYHNGSESMRTIGVTGIRVGSPSSGSSDIYMSDSNHGDRRIHCDSNRIGFLNSSNGWGAYCEDAGHWVVAGNITASGNVNSQSDIRVKENIEPILDAMQKVQSINGVTFNRNDLDDTETRYVGVIAQDVEAVLPEAVSENDEGIKQVAYGNMVGLLIEAIKEQQTQIDDLKAEIQSMKS